MDEAEQQDLPIQPVNKPILCSPFAEPTEPWVYRTDTGEPYRHPDRRPASYWYKTQATASAQMSLFAEDERDELPLVNALRADVKTWREKGWEGASTVTRELLRHWTRDDRLVEAVAMTRQERERGDSFVLDCAKDGEVVYQAADRVAEPEG